MPFALITIGILLVVTGIRDTYKQAANLIVADMTGSNDPQHRGFVMFFAALAMVGALGAIPAWRQFSHYFMALILLAILLSNTGAMQKFLAALKGARAAPVTGVAANTTTGAAAAAQAGAGAYAGGGDPFDIGSQLLQGGGIDNRLRVTVTPNS